MMRPSSVHVGFNSSEGPLQVTVNGQLLTLDPSTDPDLTPDLTLATFLRTKTKWTGTKITCHEGGCGACAVALTFTDATGKLVTRSINSCLRPLFSCNGMSITTNDGLYVLNKYTPTAIQSALAGHNGSQCGYCSNGMVMTLYSALVDNPHLTQLEIEQLFDGNLCRCTGYRSILDAMKSFASDADRKTSCLITGCKSRGIFRELEDLGRYAEKPQRPVVHTKPAIHQAPFTSKLRIGSNGRIWQDCPTVDDLNYWLPFYSSQGMDIMLVVSQTSLGVYPGSPQVRLNIAGIKEFYGITQDSNGINIGPSTAIADVIQYFMNAKAQYPYQTAHLQQAARHFQRIASTSIRNIASLMGNLALAIHHQSPEDFFCSDAATVLIGLGCNLTIRNPSTMVTTTVSLELLFTAPQMLKGSYALLIQVPWAAHNEVFNSYKIAIRQVNAHALVNAAMRCTVINGILSNPCIVFGGINASPVRYPQVEASMNGANVSVLSNLSTAVSALSSAVQPIPSPGRVTFRKTVALGYFYKFWLLLDPNLPPSLQSATQCWLHRTVSSGSQSFVPDPAEYPVSIGMPKIEAIQQTTGQAIYVDDAPLNPGALYAVPVTSTIANAAFDPKNIDTSAAQAMPGFVACYTALDLPAGCNGWINGELLSSGAITFYGEALALVVAKTYDSAVACAAAVKVTYTNVQPPITTVQQAIQQKSFFPPGVQPPPVARGDADSAISNAPIKFSGSMSVGQQYHLHMENQVTVASLCEGTLRVHSSTQAPLLVQQTCAAVTQLPGSRVVVINKRCGGGFGGKIINALQPAAFAAFCATQLHETVCVVVDMQQNMTMLGCRSSMEVSYDVGCDVDGTILGIKADIYIGAGMSPGAAQGDAVVASHNLDNAYYVPNATFTPHVMQMNLPPSTAVRGPGWVPSILVSEQIIASIASNTGLSADEVRTKNFLRNDQTTVDGMALPYWNLPQIWTQLKASAEVAERRAAVAQFNSANRWIKRGIGMTPIRFGIQLTGGNFNSTINIYPDGSIGVTHGGCEIGQGINTKVAQVVAYKLGLTKDQLNLITINETTTRSISAATNVTGGSITSELCCLSLMHACEQLNSRLAPFRTKGASWTTVIGAALNAGIDLTVAGWTDAPSAGTGIFNYNSTAAAVSEIELDTLTGNYEVRRVDILFDCGISMNPIIDIGQVEGGFVFGMGYFLLEETFWDPNTGAPQNATTWEYKVPASASVPEVLNTTLLPNSSNPYGVLSSKAVGEPGTALPASIVQAIENAVTAARVANGLGSRQWVAPSTPLTVDKVCLGCGTQSSNFSL